MFHLITKTMLNTSKGIQLMLVFLLSISLFSCKDDNGTEPALPEPTIDKVEVGLNNNEIGLIGRDFHFNVDVVAGDRIEDIQIKIVQRPGETYANVWSFERNWTQYKDARNANVHAHFSIPTDAAEGKYDFLIIVNDQNGTSLEEKRSILYTIRPTCLWIRKFWGL